MFEFLNTIKKTASNVIFILDVASDFLCEYLCFLLNRDYREFIRNVARNLAQKNILYVKMFQAISLNNNLIDGAMNAELLKYTDCAPYEDADIDYELFDEVTRKYYLTPFNDVIPINSGMISLVYKMRTVDNETVIVKMKRKNIDEKLDDAIEKLLFFIKLLSFIPQFNTLDIPNVIKKNIYLLKQQLDFEEEVKNTIEMANNCANLNYIKIPGVYEYATKEYPSIIIMDYINGTHISKLDEKDYDEYAKLVLKYGFVSIINDSVTHGDLHAGNIIFIKNKVEPIYQLGLIDFGIVTRVNKETTQHFLEIISTMFTETSLNLAEKVLNAFIEPRETFQRVPVECRENLYNEASKVIEEAIHNSKDASQVKIYEFMKKFNEYLNGNNLRSFGLYVSDDFVKFQMALAMSQGVSLCLCKNDYMPFANKVLNELFHTDLLFSDVGDE
jgi:predicted unusual protein kinase regulating ubiquinone biosynthesis (AarF/ABC1/UbiB family)